MNILILGAGSFAKEVADLAVDLHWDVAGFVVDVDEYPKDLLGRPVWHVQNLKPDGLACVPAIVSPLRRGLADQVRAMGFPFVALVHPSCSVSVDATVIDGAVASRLVCVCRGATLSFCSIVNRGATIGHDVLVGPYATVGPGANLAGGCSIGLGATVGMGAQVLEGRRIGAGAVVGAGSVVTRDVPPGETWWGVPAEKRR